MTETDITRHYAGALAQAPGDVAGLADGGFGGCAAPRPKAGAPAPWQEATSTRSQPQADSGTIWLPQD
jgi:hypothetical protein